MVTVNKSNPAGSRLSSIGRTVAKKFLPLYQYVNKHAKKEHRLLLRKATRSSTYSNSIPSYKTIALFLTIQLIVSLSTHKLALVIYDDDAGRLSYTWLETYFWLPSIFLLDAVYIICAIFVYKCTPSTLYKQTQTNKRFAALLWIAVLSITSFVALVLSSIEIKSLVSRGETVSWGMTFLMLDDWDSWKLIIMDKAHEGVPVWKVSLILISIAVFATKQLMKRSILEPKTVTVGRLPLSSNVSSVGKNMNTLQKVKGKRVLSYGVLYSLLVMRMRPTNPYQSFSSTLMFSVPVAIMNGADQALSWKSAIDDSKQVDSKNLSTSPDVIMEEGDPNEPPHNLNIVMLLLETMRADMFPFDPTTPWAKRKIPEASVLVTETENKVTPFYADWVKRPSTLYIPHIRGAAGFTHKALWSIFCSAYAKPVTSTKEHESHHTDCLPHLLQKSGHGYNEHQFFKAITSHFDKQFQLAQNIGFESMYGMQEYDEEYLPSKEFQELHTATVLGYEDDIMIDPLEKWIDSRPNKTEPFLLSYLTGITHDNDKVPPNNQTWKARSYVEYPKNNALLNNVAYTDRFVSTVIKMFERRGLMNDTLFVIMGDHGGNFQNRDEKHTTYRQHTEECFDIGVSFYTENKEVSEVLTNVKNSDIIKNGDYSSLDIAPTILDLLNYYGGHNNTLLNGMNENSIVNGRSMLHPSGKRLQLAIANPGDGMVFKDGFYVALVPSSRSKSYRQIKLYDLEKDPNQERPMSLSPRDRNSEELLHWGGQAVKFVKKVELDLILNHKTGRRCNNCALSYLNSLESLDQWSGYRLPSEDSTFISRFINICLVLLSMMMIIFDVRNTRNATTKERKW